MSTDLYSSVLFSDGEGIVLSDLHAMQRNIHAMLTDQILQSVIGGVANTGITQPDFGGQNGANVPTLWAYTLSPGAAYLRLGSANNKIQVAPGTLLQKIANSDGGGSSLAPFWFDGSSAGEFTLGNGDATNPRIDLLQMKLEYISDTPVSRDFKDAVSGQLTTNPLTASRRRVQCTLSVKQGTPAGSPRIPDPDTGFVPLGFALVGPGWTSSGGTPQFGANGWFTLTNKVLVFDIRMPVKVRPIFVPPSEFRTVINWAITNSGSSAMTSSSTNTLLVPCPAGAGRIIGVSTQLINSTPIASGFALGQFAGDSANINVPFLPFAMPVTTGASSNFVTRQAIESTPNLHASNNPLPSTSGYGIPIWANGHTAPQFDPNAGGTIVDQAALSLTNVPSGTIIGAVKFWIAEGL